MMYFVLVSHLTYTNIHKAGYNSKCFLIYFSYICDMAKVGRPLKFETAEELAKVADSYFVQSEQDGEPLTITGLALHLGFESRQSFYDYEERGEFSYTIKRARMRVENAYEKNLHGQNATGSIFALKNFGWVDKTNLDHTTNGKDIAPPIKWIDGTDK